MFRKICLFVVVCGISITTCGCQMAIGGLEAAGHLGAFNSSESSSNPLLGTETERHNFKKYEVGVSIGFYQNGPGIIFMAYDQGVRTKFLFYSKNDSDDMKMMENFNRMNETEKKLFIMTRFLKIVKLDLGPIEPEIAEKPPTAPSLSAPGLPIPAFTPGALPH